MAQGSELYLGFVGENAVKEILKSLHLEYDEENGLTENQTIASALKTAHRDALTELGLEVFDASSVTTNGRPADENYVYVKGGDGKIRQTCVFPPWFMGCVVAPIFSPDIIRDALPS